jgi:hypothetical protein
MADLNPTAAEFPNMQPLTEVELDVVHCYSAKNYEPSKNVEMSWADPTLGIKVRLNNLNIKYNKFLPFVFKVFLN